ncbi:polyisoprenyl-teichoic acid--peptidoglycan teichoic acid transferase TagV [Virgibacillus siamensis]|uniref:Polyisoprenyl-teichoic acid--peptidoglycan teichoic acid transferase TagV n=1 Tax=Virgibacillus siamensis TaxID=480071 RepID=A0ABP3QUR6_9BACI
MVETRSNSTRHKRKSWKKPVLLIILLLLLLLTVIVIYAAFQGYQAAEEAYHGLDRPGEKSALRNKSATIGEDPISLLLMGVETYATHGQNGRADTLVVVTLNPETNEMTMTSVPRDTRVNLPAEAVGQYAGYHKINAAYTYGSISGYGNNKLTVEAVEDTLNIPIDEYIAVNFKGFRNIVDALGGVTIDIKEGFWEKNIFNDNKRIYFEEGKTTLNGEEALAFVRMRKRDVNTVYPRDARQRQFIQAAVDKAISIKTLFNLGEISDILGKNVETSLRPKEIFNLVRTYASLDSSKIQTTEIGGSDQRVGGSIYFIPSEQGLNQATSKLRESLNLK